MHNICERLRGRDLLQLTNDGQRVQVRAFLQPRKTRERRLYTILSKTELVSNQLASVVVNTLMYDYLRNDSLVPNNKFNKV